MLRRSLNESERKEQLAYIHGRIDQQIETWADRFGWNPMELGTHLGAILIGAESNSLSSPTLSKSKTGKRSTVLEEVEVVSGTHVGRAQSKRRRGRPRKTSSNKVTTGNWFSKLSKRKQKEVIAKRVESTRKTLEAKKRDQSSAA